MRSALVAVACAVMACAAVAAAPAATAGERRVIGHSVEGRPIIATYVGEPDARTTLVVLGQMHGSEPGGRSVIDDLTAATVPTGVGLWLVRSMNPDGNRAGTRRNARGVDLNRNFPVAWRSSARGPYWSGRAAASEPETRAMVRFLTRVRPAALVSFHQAFDTVDITHSPKEGRLLAGWMGEQARRVPCAGPCHGTLTQWAHDRLDTVALTVELDRRTSDREARRAAQAVLRLGEWLGR